MLDAGKELSMARGRFASLVQLMDESHEEGKMLVSHPLFSRLGLADAAIATVCTRGTLVLTTDLNLQLALQQRGADALNFNHVRPLAWTQQDKAPPSWRPWDNEVMDNVTFETQDLRVRIEDKVARIDQRKLNGELWKEIDQSTLPIPEQWFSSPIRTSPLKVDLLAFERENPGNMTLRIALKS